MQLNKGNKADFHWKTFAEVFIKNPASVGALFPASPYLAKSMVSDLLLTSEDLVLELGPGTGAITHSIRGSISGANYIGVEREERFVNLLSLKFPEMYFVHGLAETAVDIVNDAGQPKPKAIISSLPFASLAPSVQDNILMCVDELMEPGSIFRTYQYLNGYCMPAGFRFRKRIDKILGKPHSKMLQFFNLPPAIVFTWKR